ncbi:MAG TPA: CBS domain-containing protein [Candidatus Limnocylindria bacterium]|nr:CBS domain-containing protein [Candidatus Limnocylindria bacterium]
MSVRPLGPASSAENSSPPQARDLLAREKIRHLLVTGPGGALAGIVTDRDIRLNLPSRATSLSVGEINHLLTKVTVGEIMTRSVITIGPDRPARDGARLMLDYKIGALPVLDDGRLIGITTETDIVRKTARPRAESAGDAGEEIGGRGHATERAPAHRAGAGADRSP